MPPVNNFLLEWWPLILFMALECQPCTCFWNQIQAGRFGYPWMHVFMTAFQEEWHRALPSVWCEWHGGFGSLIKWGGFLPSQLTLVYIQVKEITKIDAIPAAFRLSERTVIHGWASTTVAGFGEEVTATQDGFPSPGKREGAWFQNRQMHALRLHR